MSELVIPDAVYEVIPPGWLTEIFVPAVADADWEALDDAEGRVRAMVAYLDAHDTDSVILEQALRVIEARRGELLGPEVTQGHRTDLTSPRMEKWDVSSPTAARYRAIARNWGWLYPERILPATRRAQVTQTACLRYITEHTPARPDVDLPDVARGEMLSLLHGDFRERLSTLEPGSVDLILTDPPYPKEDLPLWYDLAELATKVLAPRGLLIAYSGQIFLPEVIELVTSGGMTYGWTFALQLPGSGSRILGRHIIQAWKPVLAFSTGTWPSGEWGDDWLISPAPDKVDYEWQQNVAPARRLIERFSAPGALIVDPFLGVGSFGVAAREAGRRFVGVELDAGRFRTAQRNLDA